MMTERIEAEKATLIGFDSNGRFWRQHNQPELLTASQRCDGYMLKDAIPPAPETVRGESATLYVKDDARPTVEADGTTSIRAADLEWRVTTRPWTQEELLEDIQERLARLEAALIPAKG